MSSHLRSLRPRRAAPGWILCCLALGLWAATTRAAAVIPLFSQRNWHRSDGLPSNEVTALCQDRAGYLWVATSVGLARFDGTHFVRFTYAPGTDRASVGFSAMIADPADDGLWLAPRSGGLLYFSQGVFTPSALPVEFAGKSAEGFFFAADGALWISFAGGGVVRKRGGQTEVFGVRDGLGSNRRTHIAGDNAGGVWLAQGTTLAKYDHGALRPLDLAGLKEDLRIASARTDGPWVLTRGWLHKIVDGQITLRTKISSDFNAVSVQALLEDSNGAIWTGTRARGVRRLTLPDQKSDLAVNAPEDVGLLLEDRSGNIWAGSNGGGLVRVRSGVLRRYDKNEGLLENHSLSVCQDEAGTLWFANRDGGVAFINARGRVQSLVPLKVRDTFTAFSITPAPADGIWVTSSHGLLRATTTGLWPTDTPGAPPQPPDHRDLRVSHTAKNGDLWLALGPGRMGRLRGLVWEEMTGFGSATPQSIAEDAQGRIWIGTGEARLYRFDAGAFAAVPLVVPTTAGAIQTIHFDAGDTGWIGTAGAGLLRLDAPAGRTLDERHGLPTKNINQIIADDHGALWFGSPEGIFYVRREHLEDFFAGRSPKVDPVTIGVDEGLNEATCLGAHQPSVWKDRSGLLWFSTRQGLVAIDPRRTSTATHPLGVRIDTVRSNGVGVATEGLVRLPAPVQTVEIDYSVLCLSHPERVRTQFRLRGYEQAWTAADRPGLARYSRLPPGEYFFEASAHLSGVSGSTTTVTLPLVIEAAWWQTLWFQCGIAGVVLMIGVLVIQTWSHR
jgi:ligand-binding sensor domain-containing protein